jgi:hypothetical protein
MVSINLLLGDIFNRLEIRDARPGCLTSVAKWV